MDGAWSQDDVNLFYSILSLLNEALSYIIGHLHLGIDANTYTNPVEADELIISEYAGLQRGPSHDSKCVYNLRAPFSP